jgi:hypothetical protein
MAVGPQVHFINGQVLFRTGFVGAPSPQVAMADECCCDVTTTRPGYAIKARDCCSGAQIDIALYLDSPPVWAFTKIWWSDDLDTCFKFDLGDIGGEAVLQSDIPGMDQFLENIADFVQYEDCNSCRCANEQYKCCYPYETHPVAPESGRSGQQYFVYAGVTVRSELFTCKLVPGLFDPVTAEQVYVQHEPFAAPNGVYAFPASGCGEIKPAGVGDFNLGSLQWEWGPITMKYYLDASCSPSNPSNIADFVANGAVGATNMSMSAVDGTAGISNSVLFDEGGLPEPTLYCDPVTYANINVDGDANAGFGGTITFHPCCPEDEGF